MRFPLLLCGFPLLLTYPAFFAQTPSEPGSSSNLPLWFGAGAAAGAGVVAGGARWRHVLARKQILVRFDSFKERVIGLRERVEALERRHDALPQAEAYRKAMSGATEALYTQMKEEFDRLREEWRKRMELWDKIKGLVETQGPLGAGRFHEAGRLLDTLGAFDAVDQSCDRCTQQLDRLEHARTEVGRRQRQVEEKIASLHTTFQAISDLQLPTDAYGEEQARAQAIAHEAQPLQENDPIGAADALILAEDKLTALAELVAEVPRQFARREELQSLGEQVFRAVTAKRSSGLLLEEPEGNPDSLLAHADSSRNEALTALQRCDPMAARSALDQAAESLQHAQAVVERQEAARAACLRDLPICRAETERLHRAEAEAQAGELELERDFANSSWRDVAGHRARGRELMASTAILLDEAEQAASESTQHYFRAEQLIGQVRGQQGETVTLFSSIGDALRKLTLLREEILRRLEILAQMYHDVETTFAGFEGAIRDRSRAPFASGQHAFRRARDEARAGRADWDQVKRLLDEAERYLKEAEGFAKEDIRLSQRAVQAIADAERALASVQADPQAGYQANLATAQELLSRAHRNLSLKDYELAAHDAAEAQHSAARARDAVLARLRAEEQQRQAALAAAAASTATLPTPLASPPPSEQDTLQPAWNPPIEPPPPIPETFDPPPAPDTTEPTF